MASNKQKESKEYNFIIILSAVIIIAALLLALGVNLQNRLYQKEVLRQLNSIQQQVDEVNELDENLEEVDETSEEAEVSLD